MKLIAPGLGEKRETIGEKREKAKERIKRMSEPPEKAKI